MDFFHSYLVCALQEWSGSQGHEPGQKNNRE